VLTNVRAISKNSSTRLEQKIISKFSTYRSLGKKILVAPMLSLYAIIDSVFKSKIKSEYHRLYVTPFNLVKI
jgi:hypothetical protein